MPNEMNPKSYCLIPSNVAVKIAGREVRTASSKVQGPYTNQRVARTSMLMDLELEFHAA